MNIYWIIYIRVESYSGELSLVKSNKFDRKNFNCLSSPIKKNYYSTGARDNILFTLIFRILKRGFGDLALVINYCPFALYYIGGTGDTAGAIIIIATTEVSATPRVLYLCCNYIKIHKKKTRKSLITNFFSLKKSSISALNNPLKKGVLNANWKISPNRAP